MTMEKFQLKYYNNLNLYYKYLIIELIYYIFLIKMLEQIKYEPVAKTLARKDSLHYIDPDYGLDNVFNREPR